MEIQGYTLQRPLTNSVQSQAFLAKNEQGELVRLIRCFDSHNKSLAPSLERLKRAGLVKNDFILPISVASESNDELVVATRFVHDGSLFNKAQVGDQHALSIIERLADGLRSAHDKGVWHGCLSRSVIYRTGSESDDVVIDLLDLLVSKQFNATMQDESQWFAEDVLQLGNLILEIFKPESRDTTTNKQLFDLVHDMTQLDWANRPSMSEVRGRIILLQKNSPTMAGEDPSNATDATMELDADAMESMSVRAQSSKTPVQLGRFVIERQIGEGGMGTVLLGRDQSNSQRVAIKLLAQQWAGDERSTRRFEREARLLSIVKHPAIAQLIEFGRSDQTMYLVMEYVSGGCLSDFTRIQQPIDEPLAIRFIADAANGLEVAHRSGLIHRDIKPANLLLTERGKRSMERMAIDDSVDVATDEPLVKVADFGLAKHYESSETMAMTRTGMIMGTPLYMSPEQCRGESIGPQSDVYSLGATLYQCLVGRTPFLGQTPIEIFRKHCDEPVPSIRSINGKVSDAVQNIVEKCLAKNPLMRYQHAGELAIDLEGILLGTASSIVMHPAIPDSNTPGQLCYRYQWKLRSSSELIWPYVSNTDRVNHAIGLPAVRYKTLHDPKLGLRRIAMVRAMGMNMEWEEHPYEWVEGRRLSVLRQFPSGPFYWFTNVVELQPQSDGGTLVVQTLNMRPRNFLGKLFAKFQIGAKSERNFGRVYEKIDAYLQSNSMSNATANPFSVSKPMTREQKRRLSERMGRVRAAANHIAPEVLDTLEQFVEYASDLDVARLRPLAFAERFGLDKQQTVQACLLAAREGVLVLLWDILCPTCRIPSDVQETLKSLADHGHCEACNADYELDFSQSIELIFRAHVEVRTSETRTYCIGGPAFSSHVVAQIRLEPDERLTESLALGDGQYRLRGPQLPFVIDFRVSQNSRVSRWDVDLTKPPSQANIPILRSGEQVFCFLNNHVAPRQIRIERLASRADALTAAEAARIPAFREWFPDEVLSPGQMLSLTTVTLMNCQIANVGELYAAQSDQAACSQLLRHLQAIAAIVNQHAGCVIKSMNDGLNTVFPSVARALQAAKEISEASVDWSVRIVSAIHQGSAIVATINDRLDYFGHTPQFVDDLLRRSIAGEICVSDESWNESGLNELFGRNWTVEMRTPLTGWPKWHIVVLHRSDRETVV